MPSETSAERVRLLMGWFSTTCVPAVMKRDGTPDARMMQPAITERAALPVQRNTRFGRPADSADKLVSDTFRSDTLVKDKLVSEEPEARERCSS